MNYEITDIEYFFSENGNFFGNGDTVNFRINGFWLQMEFILKEDTIELESLIGEFGQNVGKEYIEKYRKAEKVIRPNLKEIEKTLYRNVRLQMVLS